MRLYEMVLALRPGLDQDQFGAARQSIDELIQQCEARIEDAVDLGVKRLAYEVDGETQGHFLKVYFHAGPSHVKELFRGIESRDDVIRLAITKQITPLPKRDEKKSDEDVSTE